METAVCVWQDNLTDIKKIINKIRFDYKLDSNFHLEAENLFHEKFEKYYDDGKQYLSFFYSCLTNKAKNVYRKRIAESKLITSIQTSDGRILDALDFVDIQPHYNQTTFLDDMHIDHIYKQLEDKLEEYEFDIFKYLVDGRTKIDIKESYGINESVLQLIIDNIKGELQPFFEFKDTKYIKGPFEVNGVMYDYKLIDEDGEDYCTIEQLGMWINQ